MYREKKMVGGEKRSSFLITIPVDRDFSFIFGGF